MSKLILKIIWNALPIVALVLGVAAVIYDGPSRPEPTPTSTITGKGSILESIKHVNKQIFIEHYSMVDVQYSEVPVSWLPFIKQDVVVLLRGRIPAGFDLQQLSEDDIWISSDGKRVQLTLPPPIVFEDNVAIDFENSRILAQNDTCPDFVCSDTLEAYQGEILPAGRNLLIEFAYKSGILDQAARDGKAYYEQFMNSLDFEEVRVVVEGYGL